MLFSVMSGGSPYLRAFSWAMLAGEPNPACSAKPSALTLGIMFEEKRVAAASAFLVGVGVMGLCGCNCSCLDVCEPILETLSILISVVSCVKFIGCFHTHFVLNNVFLRSLFNEMKVHHFLRAVVAKRNTD